MQLCNHWNKIEQRLSSTGIFDSSSLIYRSILSMSCTVHFCGLEAFRLSSLQLILLLQSCILSPECNAASSSPIALLSPHSGMIPTSTFLDDFDFGVDMFDLTKPRHQIPHIVLPRYPLWKIQECSTGSHGERILVFIKTTDLHVHIQWVWAGSYSGSDWY